MAFFDFLKDATAEKKAVKGAAKGVFSFLGGHRGGSGGTVREQLLKQAKAEPNNQILQRAAQKPQQTTTPFDSAVDLGVSTARAVPREAASIGKSGGEVINNVAGAPNVPNYDPNTNRVARIILGSEPIKTLGERQAGAQQAVKNNPQFSGVAGPLSFLGVAGTSALNLTPTPKPKKETIDALTKSTDISQVKKTLQGLIPGHKVEEVAPAVALSKDPHIVSEMISKANFEPPAPVRNFVKDYGDSLQQMESGFRGGGMVPSVEGGYVRTSEHSPFYRKFYSDNGRAPTKTDWHEEGLRQLESGTADPHALKEYNALKNPEVSSLLQQPEGYFARDNTVGNVSQPDVPAMVPPDPAPPKTTIPPGPPLGDRTRGYYTSAQQADNLSPETKQGISDIKPQTYTQKPNTELISKSKQLVEDKPQEALQRVFEGADTRAQYDENVAIGGHLIQKAQKEGRIEDAVRIAERLGVQGTELGRGVQAYAAIHRLSPEGILLYAQRQIRKAREGKANFTQETPEASGLKRQVEGFKPEDKAVVQRAIKDTVEGLVPSTGEKLAKRVEKAAKPAVSKKTDTLLQELTKKVKQELLEPKTKQPKDPLHILQETFGRSEEAGKAYPEAQSLLREKYADNPQMSEALDKFFGSKLGDVPAAGSTVDKAIQNELRDKKVQVMKAIYKSWAEQKQTVEDVARTLTKEGFSEENAQILAKEVTGRLNKQFGETKAKVLERLAADVPEKARQTYIDKINKLSNIGALDKADYIDLARAKLNLPNLKPGTAKELSDLAQHVQTLPEGADKYAATRRMKQLIEENTPLTGKQKVAQGFGTSRALLASGDISFGGRQALAYATSHPLKFAKQWTKQFKFFKEGFQGDDSRAFDELMGEIQAHPDYKTLQKTDLALTDPFGISPNAREEQFIGTHYAEKIPALGRLVRGSNYAFTGLANSIRANEFYSQLEHARAAGLDLKPKLLDDLAEVINTSTGRGNAKFLEDHMKSLSTALFAPRLILSRLQTFNLHYYLKLEPAARKEAIRNLVSLSAFATGTLTIASQIPGVDVGLDPRSSDFGKVKIGDTRLDFLGGFTQYIKLGAQLASGETISSLSGRASQLGSGYGKKSRKDIVVKFLENKENPVVSFATTLLQGSDAVGNPVKTPSDISKQLISRFVPLVAQDVTDMQTHEKGLNPLLGAPLAAVGVGTQTYGKGDIKLSDKQQQVYDALEKNGAPKGQLDGYKDFYQTLKTTPDRQAASDSINEALKNENYDKARKLANDYNKQYAATFKDWAKQHGQYEDATLRKEYNSKKILLTGDNIRTRLRNIRKNQLITATTGGTQ